MFLNSVCKICDASFMPQILLFADDGLAQKQVTLNFPAQKKHR